jgi:hypothetical protein
MNYIRLLALIFVLCFAAYTCEAKSVALSTADKQAIERAISEKIGFKSYGGDLFCVYTVLGSRTASNGEIAVYTIGATSEFTKSDQTAIERSGSVCPVVLRLKEGVVTSAERPGDGGQYAPDIRRLFPRRYHSVIFSGNKQPLLAEELRQKVASTYNLPLKQVHLSSD